MVLNPWYDWVCGTLKLGNQRRMINMANDSNKEFANEILRKEISNLEINKKNLQKKLEKEFININSIKSSKVNVLMNEIDSVNFAIQTLYTIIGREL